MDNGGVVGLTMNFAKWRDVWRRFSGHGTYPHELAPILLIPLRRMIFSPKKLVRYLELTSASRVLEVGPGPGFFSVDVARAAPDGRLELVDIQIEMLQKARSRLRRAGVRNTGYTRADAATLPFCANAFDAAFLVAVLGEIPDPKAALAAITRVLRPGGLLLVVELRGDPDAMTEPQLRALTQGTDLEFADASQVSRCLVARLRRRRRFALRERPRDPKPGANYEFDILDGERVVARYWFDFRGDDHGVVFDDGRDVWLECRRSEFITGGGPDPTVFTKRALAWLEVELGKASP